MFRILQKYFKTTETDFHTFSKSEKNTLKIIIKGLTTDITEEELADGLKGWGYDVSFVRQFIKNGWKFSIHKVTPQPTPDNKAIFNEREIFYILVKIEAYRNNNPAQYYNCQRFGHSSLYRGFSPCCVKYIGLHLAKDCKKTDNLKKSMRIQISNPKLHT